MSMITLPSQLKLRNIPKRWLTRLCITVAAVAVVVIALVGVSYVIFAAGLFPAPTPRNPFITGPTTSTITPSGLSALVLALQAQFYVALTSAVQAIKTDGAGIASLATVGFLYGIFHAAGPGHGKGVISGYLVATRGSVGHGLALSVAAALLQAIVAISIVGVFAIVLRTTASSIDVAIRSIELMSFAAVTIIGAVLLWSKSGELANLLEWCGGGAPLADSQSQHVTSRRDWKVLVSIILAAGIRPCSGAIILLVFALSQDIFLAGVVGALAMAIGTSITTGTLAIATISVKSMAGRLRARNDRFASIFFSGVELIAAGGVFILGILLFLGVGLGGPLGILD